jgi:prepilin-type N-terminal cleavage/methylation domain-containing protein
VKRVQDIDNMKTNKGFTLVEMIVAVALFAIVMTVATGAIFTIVNANRNAQSINSVITNLNFAVESMLRDIRTGYDYSCGDGTGSYGDLGNAVHDCPTGAGGSSVAFVNSEGAQVQYRFDSINHKIVKKTNALNSEVDITAPEVYVDTLTYFVDGATVPGQQPHMLVRIKGSAGSVKNKSNFDIQTYVSQRALNLP